MEPIKDQGRPVPPHGSGGGGDNLRGAKIDPATVVIDELAASEGFLSFVPNSAKPGDMIAVEFDWRKLTPVERMTTAVLPSRLSVEPSSPFYCGIYIRRVEVFLNGVALKRVIEYNLSEGWVREHRVPRKNVRVSRNGKVIAFKRTGSVTARLVTMPGTRVASDTDDPAVTPEGVDGGAG